MAALRAPFEATNLPQLFEKISAGKFNRIPSQYSDELQKLLQCMMCVEQSKRPTVEALMMHSRICYFNKALEVKRRERDLRQKEIERREIEKVVKEKKDIIESKRQLLEIKMRKIQDLK